MNIKKQIIFLSTNDLKATTHFYSNLIKLDLFLDQGDCVIFKTSDNGYIGFCERPVNIVKGKIIITFIVENVDHIYEDYLSISDIKVSPPTINHKYRIYHFFITDPNGYLIEFQKFLDEVNW
jgi:predicted enzyme related to lactoylglutathione lyase